MRKSELLLAVALSGSVAMSAWLWTELSAERARNVQLRAHADSLRTLDTAPQPVAHAPRLELPAAPTTADTSTHTPPPRVAKDTEQDQVAYQGRLLQQPKYREAWRAQQRLGYALRRE